jgi:hypothetical protein
MTAKTDIENTEDSNAVSVESTVLLADLWWLEYQDAAEDARDALHAGDKMKALALAIWAHKIKCQYEYYANRLIFG